MTVSRPSTPGPSTPVPRRPSTPGPSTPVYVPDGPSTSYTGAEGGSPPPSTVGTGSLYELRFPLRASPPAGPMEQIAICRPIIEATPAWHQTASCHHRRRRRPEAYVLTRPRRLRDMVSCAGVVDQTPAAAERSVCVDETRSDPEGRLRMVSNLKDPTAIQLLSRDRRLGGPGPAGSE
jgi:hypothetical protein